MRADSDRYHVGLELVQRIAPYITGDMQFAVYAFNTQLKQIAKFTDPPGTLDQKIRELPLEWQQPRGWTALWGSISSIVDGLENYATDSMLVVFSDGADNRSKITPTEIASKLIERHVRLFGLLVAPTHLRRSFGETAAADNLKLVVNESGGEMLRIDQPSKGKTWREEDIRAILGQLESAYQLDLKLLSAPVKDSKWKLRLKGLDGKIADRFSVLYPAKLTTCEDHAAAY
jgi:hypothetical protein